MKHSLHKLSLTDWYIIFWVAIPFVAILLILCCVRCNRKRRYSFIHNNTCV